MSDPAPREVDLRGIDLSQLTTHTQTVIDAVTAGESLVVLADHQVVLNYLVPTAATNGLRCRFGPPNDGVWRIDLSPRQAPASAEAEARKE